MLTCMARSKSEDDSSVTDDHHKSVGTTNGAKTLSNQIKDIAVKASGAYRHCTPCAIPAPEKFAFRRTAGRKELEARLKGISSGGATKETAATASGRRVEPVVFEEEGENQEWVAQVEPGVLITFVSSLRGSNELKRIRFSRELFNKLQAQRWWTENSEKVLELYNVQRLNRQAVPLPTTPKSEDDTSLKMKSNEQSPFARLLDRALTTGTGTVESSSDSSMQSQCNDDSCGVVNSTTPKLSSGGGAKTETSSMDVSLRTSLSKDADRSGDISISNGGEMETEWVEEDEPGVYITVRALPDGTRELKRVRFSREKYGEMHARVWWEENRARIHKQYL